MWATMTCDDSRSCHWFIWRMIGIMNWHLTCIHYFTASSTVGAGREASTLGLAHTPTREAYTDTGSIVVRQRVRNGLRLKWLALTIVYGPCVMIGSKQCMLRLAAVPHVVIAVSHSYYMSRIYTYAEGHWWGSQGLRSLCRSKGCWCWSHRQHSQCLSIIGYLSNIGDCRPVLKSQH